VPRLYKGDSLKEEENQEKGNTREYSSEYGKFVVKGEDKKSACEDLVCD
jgi:hypothetical protein